MIEPYVGPRSFGRDIVDQDEEGDEIVSLISAHKLVLVYAQSGAGKTSIFNAHLFIH
jgi:putative ribosome biogenesis GTPase RsgA